MRCMFERGRFLVLVYWRNGNVRCWAGLWRGFIVGAVGTAAQSALCGPMNGRVTLRVAMFAISRRRPNPGRCTPRSTHLDSSSVRSP